MTDILEKAPIEKLDWRTVATVTADAPKELVDALDAYFAPFAALKFRDGDKSKETVCLNCDKPLTGIMAAFFGGGFEWGLAHGEGHCAACRWPARAHHFICEADGKELVTIRNFVLQYHPDFVERRA